MTRLLRDTGFRSAGSVIVLVCLVIWHLSGVLFIVGGVPPRGIGVLGGLLCRATFYSALMLIPGTLAISCVRRFGHSRHPFDYHGPILALLAPFAMIAEAFLFAAGLGIQ